MTNHTHQKKLRCCKDGATTRLYSSRAGGLKITAKLLAEAMRSLPEEKRQAVLLYYFFSMTDTEIAELMKVPRSTVQYRRSSSFDLLKRYLEERADEWNEL